MKATIAVLMSGLLISFGLAAAEQQSDSHNHNIAGHQHPMKGDHAMSGPQEQTHGETHDSMAGKPGDPAGVNQTIEISMDDTMRFTPGQITVQAGDTVRLFIRNNGKLEHELVIGTMEELTEHAKMMRDMPDMDHAEANMIRLAPGQRGSLIWQFDFPGEIDFACLVPGHYEAGMYGSIDIESIIQ